MSGSDAALQCLPMLLQTPPGQLQNVLADLKGICASSMSESELLAQAQPYLEQHAHEQLLHVPLEHDGRSDDGIVCAAARIETPQGSRYVQPRLGCTFAYDYARETASDLASIDVRDCELRAAVDEALGKYVYNHYHTGVSLVFAKSNPPASSGAEQAPVASCNQPEQASTGADVKDVEGENAEAKEEPENAAKKAENDMEESKETKVANEGETPAAPAPLPATSTPQTLTLHIVGNKYNLRNFWAGRWRSSYTYEVASRTVSSAEIRAHAHYFENGNVQMQTKHVPQLPELAIPADATAADVAKALVSAIEKHEQAYQMALADTTEMLRERAFKALRRALPLTREKIDWDKAVSYKLGSELSRR